MDILKMACAQVGAEPKEGAASRDVPHLFFGAKLTSDRETTLTDPIVRVYPNGETAERAAREFVGSAQPYQAIAWIVGADHGRSSWSWAAERFGPAALWQGGWLHSTRLPGEEYAETWLTANTSGHGWVNRVQTALAGERLTIARAGAAHDALSILAPHLDKIQPADLKHDDPPRGLDVWRLPPGERPEGKVTLAGNEAQLARVRSIMRAPAYDAKARPGAGVTIAVLDTGVEASHPVFTGVNLKALDATGEGGERNDSNGHGTWCAGAIGGVAPDDGGTPYRGIAAGCALLCVKVLTRQGWGTDAMIARGIEIAVSAGVDGISMSLGGAGEMPRTRAAIKAAEAAGIPITAAAGNEGPGEGTVGFPGGYIEVECVGALTQDDPPQIAQFSSRGPELDVCAPGVSVYGAWAGGRYTAVSGTSMATPLVAAARAIARATRLTFPPEQQCPKAVADAAVYGSVYQLPGWADRPTWFGAGAVDIGGAIQYVTKASQPKPPSPPPPPPPTPGEGFMRRLSPTAGSLLTAAYIADAITAVEDALSHGNDAELTITVKPKG